MHAIASYFMSNCWCWFSHPHVWIIPEDEIWDRGVGGRSVYLCLLFFSRINYTQAVMSLTVDLTDFNNKRHFVANAEIRSLHNMSKLSIISSVQFSLSTSLFFRMSLSPRPMLREWLSGPKWTQKTTGWNCASSFTLDLISHSLHPA